MNETLLLDLVNSRLVSSDGVHDELADDRAAAEWLRRHDAPSGPAQVADARAVRAALVVFRKELRETLRSVRREAEAAGVAGVPSLLAEDGRTHWGMGGLERLLAGEPLVPRS